MPRDDDKKKSLVQLEGCMHVTESGFRIHDIRPVDGDGEAPRAAGHASTGATSDAYRRGWDAVDWTGGSGDGGMVN